MKNAVLAQMLIDNSFKEGSLYWNRNNVFMVAQTVLFGFTLNILTKDNLADFKISVFLFEVVGILIAILHIYVLKISKEYQNCWLTTFWSFVEQQKEKDGGNWDILENVGKLYKNVPKKSTSLALLVAYLFLIIWIITFLITIYVVFPGPCS